MRARKPIILVDDSPQSQKIVELFKDNEIDFVKYHIKKFEDSCCGELPTTRTPSVIAAEGIFKEESLILYYIEYMKQKKFLKVIFPKNLLHFVFFRDRLHLTV